MADEKIVEYIKSGHALGHDDIRIREELLNTGERPEDIERAFTAVRAGNEAQAGARPKDVIFFTLSGGLIGLIAGLMLASRDWDETAFFTVMNIFMFGLFGLAIGLLRREGKLNKVFLILIGALLIVQAVPVAASILVSKYESVVREKDLPATGGRVQDDGASAAPLPDGTSAGTGSAGSPAGGTATAPTAPGATGAATSASSGSGPSDVELIMFIESDDFMIIFEDYGVKDQMVAGYLATVPEEQKETMRTQLEELFSDPTEVRKVFEQAMTLDARMHDLVLQMYEVNKERKGE